MTISIVRQYFLDPIGGEPFADPILNHCGHSYSRVLLDRWKAHTNQNACPLCKAPFQSLIDNEILRQAADIASVPANRNYTRVDQFADEDREIIEVAIAQITQQRELDQSSNVPSKLDPYFKSSTTDQIAACGAEVSRKISCC